MLLLSEFEGESEIAFVISKNKKRRHLTESLFAVAAVEALPFFEAEAKERQKTLNKPLEARVPQAERTPQSRDIAGKAFGIGGRIVGQAKISALKTLPVSHKMHHTTRLMPLSFVLIV